MIYLATNGPAIAAWIGFVVLGLLWIAAVDWVVARVARAWHHRKIIARMDAVLGRMR